MLLVGLALKWAPSSVALHLKTPWRTLQRRSSQKRLNFYFNRLLNLNNSYLGLTWFKWGSRNRQTLCVRQDLRKVWALARPWQKQLAVHQHCRLAPFWPSQHGQMLAPDKYLPVFKAITRNPYIIIYTYEQFCIHCVSLSEWVQRQQTQLMGID